MARSKDKKLYYLFDLLRLGIGLYSPINTKNLIDSAVSGDSEHFQWRLILAILFTLSYIFFLGSSYYFQSNYEEGRLNEYRRRIFRNISDSDMDEVQKQTSGYYLTRYIDDLAGIRKFLVVYPYKRIVHGLNILVVVLIMLNENMLFTSLILINFPIIYLINQLMSKKLKHVGRQIQTKNEELNTELEEYTSQFYSVKANNATEQFIAINTNRLSSLMHLLKKRIRLEVIYDYFLSTGMMNIVYIIINGFGAYLILHSSITVGTLTAFSIYYSSMWSPIEFYIGYPKEKARFEMHQSRLHNLIEPYIERDSTSKVSVQKPDHRVVLKDVRICREERVLFEHVNASFHLREKIALRGANGSGKSTFANTLAKLNPHFEGDIRLNSVSYRDLRFHDVHRQIRLIPAEPEIFSGTIEDNIAMFRPVNLEKVSAILTILETNQKTLDTVVGGNLDNLSSGEKKLIQLARGLVQEAEMFILDEPLNYIDKTYRGHVLTLLREYFQDKGLIIISHDEIAFCLCERHWVIEDKNIKEVRR